MEGNILMKVQINEFKGIVPKIATHLLEDNGAQSAINCQLESGVVQGWKKPENIEQLTDTNVLALFQWLEGSNEHWVTSTLDLDEVRPPIANDSFERLYLTGGVSNVTVLAFDAQIAGSFTVGNTLYQTVNGTTVSAKIIHVIDGGATGTIYLTDETGTFQDDYPIYESALGSDLFDVAAAAFTAGTYSWAAIANNTIANVANALQITWVDNAQGATLQLNNAADLSADLGVGTFYVVTVKTKVNTGAVTVEIREADETVITTSSVVETGFTTHTLVFRATNTTTNELTMAGMGTGEIGYLDDLSIKAITNGAMAKGDSVAGNYFLPRYLVNDKVSDPFDPTTDFHRMGIPEPDAAPAFVSGHDGGGDYRAYIYTRVNRFGVEGPPSPVLSTAVYNTGNVVIDTFVGPTKGHACRSAVSGNPPHIRLYRTNSSSNSVAAFQYVKEQDISASTNYSTLEITDDVADADLGEVIPSVGWLKPDDNMRGLIG